MLFFVVGGTKLDVYLGVVALPVSGSFSTGLQRKKIKHFNRAQTGILRFFKIKDCQGLPSALHLYDILYILCRDIA